MTLDGPSIMKFSGLPLSYLYAISGGGDTFGLSSIEDGHRHTGYSIHYLKACAVNPAPAMPPFSSRNALVTQGYRDFFERAATNNDWTFWAAAGASSSQITNWLVYQNVLGRNPDAAGHAYWLGRLRQKSITRGGVMLQFSESPENKTKYGIDPDLVGVTLRMLRRPPTPAGLTQWRPSTDTQKLSALILTSPEYAARITP